MSDNSCPFCGIIDGGSSCCSEAMEADFETRLAQHQETIERQAKRVADLEAQLEAVVIERDVLRREKADLARIFATRSQKQAESISDLSFALRHVLNWERDQGGFEAPCWAYARSALGRLM